ncbi:hypothetical protein [Sphingobium yanoikuyae]|uniref:hypothetical protein n=1 Tax=Sphingobium yanoikuyae TaxID=13690 RepID=UPI00345EDD36
MSIILLPQLLGARDLPFPRLSAFGYWSFLIGGLFVRGIDLLQCRLLTAAGSCILR